jgi:hypothetical protein
MITKRPAQFEEIEKATCDCCGREIKVAFGHLDDHLAIGGYEDGKLLEAIVCIPCVKEKLQFINIQKKDSTIGYC